MVCSQMYHDHQTLPFYRIKPWLIINFSDSKLMYHAKHAMNYRDLFLPCMPNKINFSNCQPAALATGVQIREEGGIKESTDQSCRVLPD